MRGIVLDTLTHSCIKGMGRRVNHFFHNCRVATDQAEKNFLIFLDFLVKFS